MEIWKEIPRYKGIYQASNTGQIKSFRKDAPKILKTRLGTNGYLTCGITINRYAKPNMIHDLVAEAFLGERNPGFQVNHKNGNKLDNRIENLEYVTRKENAQHASRLGLLAMGSKAPWSKLNESQVRKIRSLPKKGLLSKRFAKRYGVSVGTIQNVLNGRNWRHIA